MSHFYQKLISGVALCAFFAPQLQAQVNLPATLTFSSNATAAWSDGIAEDGDGGSSDINGLTLQIFGATAAFALAPSATMQWQPVSYWATTNNFNGITPGPDPGMTLNGLPAMVIKSASQAVNFNLQSIRLIDWGGTSPRIATYDNGVQKGFISANLPNDGTAVVLTQSGALTPALFNNIDEIRIFDPGGSNVWIGVNDIALGNVALPLSLTRFTANLQADGSALLQWRTASEQNTRDFVVEQSTDGISFTAAGTVKAAGNSHSDIDYRFRTPVLKQKTFFRLQQRDLDGAMTYSNVISAGNAGPMDEPKVFPNPAATVLNITQAEGMEQISIYDINGKAVRTQSIREAAFSIDVRALPAGIYSIRMSGAAAAYQRTFVKQ